MRNFDLVVIGSGEGGKYIAWDMAHRGWRVALVERELIGGSCPNIACLPSKNVIHSAKVASLLSRASEFGLQIGPASVDMEMVFRRKQGMVDTLREINRGNFVRNGVELILGTARLLSGNRVAIKLKKGGEETIAAQRIVLSVGSRSAIPDIPGLRNSQPMTHIEALNLQRLPDKVAIIGGGFIALEFAQALRRFGSRVTIVERTDRLASREDEDVSAGLLTLLQDEGCKVLFNSAAARVVGISGSGVQLDIQTHEGLQTVDATDILVAAGRVPNTKELGLEKALVHVDERGYVAVDEHLATTAPGIWAVGDCAGTPNFTHAAFDDFRVVRDGFLGLQRSTRGRLIPSCLFTDPEVVRIGLDETRAKDAGVSYRLFHLPTASVLRTRTTSEPRGFLKMLVAANSDEILGFTAFAAEASELLAAVQTAMLGKLPYTTLRDGIFTHPTMSEGLVFLLSSEPKAIGVNGLNHLRTSFKKRGAIPMDNEMNPQQNVKLVPPFTRATAVLKVRAAEDGWNSRNPERVALAYTTDSHWRNRSEFLTGRTAIIALLTRKWSLELDYHLIKELWAFDGNRIAVRFVYESKDDDDQWRRAYGNENWEFDEAGLMQFRYASINDVEIAESERLLRWPLGRRPDDHPGLRALGL